MRCVRKHMCQAVNRIVSVTVLILILALTPLTLQLAKAHTGNQTLKATPRAARIDVDIEDPDGIRSVSAWENDTTGNWREDKSVGCKNKYEFTIPYAVMLRAKKVLVKVVDCQESGPVVTTWEIGLPDGGVTLISETKAECPLGGFEIRINKLRSPAPHKLGLLASWIALASAISLAAIVFVKRRKKQ